jgi:hypothetical protein
MLHSVSTRYDQITSALFVVAGIGVNNQISIGVLGQCNDAEGEQGLLMSGAELAVPLQAPEAEINMHKLSIDAIDRGSPILSGIVSFEDPSCDHRNLSLVVPPSVICADYALDQIKEAAISELDFLTNEEASTALSAGILCMLASARPSSN